MPNEIQAKAARIESIAEQVRRREGVEAARFLGRFYGQVAPGDLLSRAEPELVGGALSTWRLLGWRKHGTPRVRVFNPDGREDDWTSPHTVVEIVNDDMPFLVDSIEAEINRQDLSIHQVVHPVIHVRRDHAGRLVSLVDPSTAGDAATAESVMYFEITELRRAGALERLQANLESVLRDVRATVEDWRAMRLRAADLAASFDDNPSPVADADLKEAGTFLRWLGGDNFTFIGYREYDLADESGGTTLRLVPESGLGVLRDPERGVLTGLADGALVPADVAAYILEPRVAMVSKADDRSRVHRAAHLDTIMVKKFGAGGAAAGLRLFVGLFTSAVYHQALGSIPLLSRKVDAVIGRTGFQPASHDGMAVRNILESLPRDDLFQYSDDDLLATVLGVLDLQGRQRVALFIRRDPFGRFVSCLIYLPRERYTTPMRERMQRIVEDGFGGRVTIFYVQVSDSPHARLQFIVRVERGRADEPDSEEIERRLIEAGRDWRDDLRNALVAAHGEADGLEIFDLYADAFPASYRERDDAGGALHDIAKIEAVLETGEIAADLYHRDEEPADRVRFKVYRPGIPLPLSDGLPILENMGVRVIDEASHRILRGGTDRAVWLHDFGLNAKPGRGIDLDRVKASFEALFAEVCRGTAEDDGFNALVAATGLDGRRISILRAYCKYLRQAAIPFSQAYMEATLLANPQIARSILALFETMFDPDAEAGRARRIGSLRDEIEAALDAVEDLDQDRILRRYFNVVLATLRTNAYQVGADGAPKSWLAFKIDSRAVEDLPAPAPLVEIFVYAPRVEAIHLRGGKVARGGIRWSDRREDFRTEILSLMKAQMTKNSVIVPVGAKGGFVVKRPPEGGGRDALQAEGTACYRTMISGMLDLTDNLEPGGLVHPRRTVRRDGDDPYLVVAADKGTASFSDIANGLARDYGFWLGDAFASGGSAGYDHKKMGITARGAWESVKRHFREIGIDTQTRDFTCVGIGGMAGDVFGNAMRLSPRMKLVGAFNHRHIFIDPDPDPVAGLRERERLYALPHGSWSDYEAGLISKGGGVFERGAKSIVITPEMRACLGLPDDEAMTPNALIRALLKAPVDLLWFGGIGTYVKARGETHAEAGDRVNDALRIDAHALRCRVVGEGANLGCTQRGRIAYGLGGGRINTDFIDNSAGVSTSDHEVNIKILLDEVIAAGGLSREERDRLLGEMTDEVAAHVLIDNYRQSMAITHAEARGSALIGGASRLVRALERAGRLDRAVEYLPDDETLAERRAAGLGLARPEIAVLLAYSKMTLYDEILASDVPDDPSLVQDAGLYFPERLRLKFAAFVPDHRLRREISATYVTNSLTNRAGPTFVTEVGERTGAPPVEVAKAYLIARQIFALRTYWAEIEALDNAVSAAVQTGLNRDIHRLVERATIWMLRNGPRPLDVSGAIGRYGAGIAGLAERLDRLIPAELDAGIEAAAERYRAQSVPPALARRVAGLEALSSGCDIVRIAADRGRPVADVAEIHYGIGHRLSLDWLRHAADALPADTDWHAMAAAATVEDLHARQGDLTARILDDSFGGPVGGAVEAWCAANRPRIARVEAVVAELRASGAVDLAMLTVANREFRALLGR